MRNKHRTTTTLPMLVVGLLRRLLRLVRVDPEDPLDGSNHLSIIAALLCRTRGQTSIRHHVTTLLIKLADLLQRPARYDMHRGQYKYVVALLSQLGCTLVQLGPRQIKVVYYVIILLLLD